MQGFFSDKELQSKIKVRKKKYPLCGKCRLNKKAKNPKIPVSGEGRMGIMHIAEFPGSMEDAKNEHMIGREYKTYARKLKRLCNINLYEDSWLLSAINCNLPTEKKEPNKTQITSCFPYVYDEIKKRKPKLIILLGKAAVHSFFHDKISSDIGEISKWRGWVIPDRDHKAWVCPLLSPNEALTDDVPEVTETIFDQDIRRAFDYIDTPLPSFINEKIEDKVDFLTKKKDIILFLKDLIKNPTVSAFDYETTGLKPHKKIHKTLSCAISHREDYSAAFPFYDEIIPHFKQYLRSKQNLKIAARIMFEHNWSRVMLDCVTRGWLLDVNLQSHIDDNRPKITSLKFQSGIRFGVWGYDDEVKPYISSDSGYQKNRMEEVPLRDLLLYNGLDSLLEYRLGKLQSIEQLGWDWPPRSVP